MPRFRAWDGTELAYRIDGSGAPLVCIPGGPGQAVEYLGDLGGLNRHRTLILLDNRGTGESQVPHDPVTYRVDQLVRDVDALRHHLGLERMDLFGHSASGGICLLYAAAYAHRIDHLVLVSPSLASSTSRPTSMSKRFWPSAITSRGTTRRSPPCMPMR